MTDPASRLTANFTRYGKLGWHFGPLAHHAPRAGASEISFSLWRRLERYPLKEAAIREWPKRSYSKFSRFAFERVRTEEFFYSNFHLSNFFYRVV